MLSWVLQFTCFQTTYAAMVKDKSNDTFGTNTINTDILSIDVEFDAKYLYMTCNFNSEIFPPDSKNPSAFFGYIDLDVDQNPATGTTALSDYYSGSSEIGMDYYLEFLPGSTPGSIMLKDSNAKLIGMVPVVFNEKSFVVTIPLNLLGNDDGYINYTAFFGDAGEPDDVIPNQGFATNKISDSPNPNSGSGNSSGGAGCFINTVTNDSNNTLLIFFLLLSGLVFGGCIIKKIFY